MNRTVLSTPGMIALALIVGCTSGRQYDAIVRVETEQVRGKAVIKLHYFLNGRHIGVGEDAVQRLKRMTVNAGDTIKITLPESDEGPRWWAMSSRILGAWLPAGATIHFFSGNKKVPIDHTLVFRDPDQPDNVEYVWDGRSLGRGEEGLAAVGKLRIEQGCTILIVYDFCIMPGGRLPLWCDDHPMERILDRWRATLGCRFIGGLFDLWEVFNY